MNKRIWTLILSVLTILTAFTIVASAESGVTNVSTNCNVTSFTQGDEVRLQVNTKEMSICTFIAYVEYDGDLLEYQGYEGADPEDKSSVYLERLDSSRAKYVEVAVEHAESSPIVGMYSVGTKERQFAAMEPMVTLIFKAKNSGTITGDSFAVAETSDGTDGFTSESIKQASGGSNDSSTSSDETTGSRSTISKLISEGDSSSVVLIVIIATIIALIAMIIFIKRRKNNNNNLKEVQEGKDE